MPIDRNKMLRYQVLNRYKGYTHIRLFYTSKRKNERKKVPRWCCQSAFFSENSLENFASERLSDVVISPF